MCMQYIYLTVKALIHDTTVFLKLAWIRSTTVQASELVISLYNVIPSDNNIIVYIIIIHRQYE